MNFDRILVEEVRRREFLYNKRLQSYRNIDLRERGWQQIAAATKAEARVCKMRWKTLRDRFCKEAGKKPTWKLVRQWPLFEKLLFLKEHVTRRAGGTFPLLEDIVSPPPSEIELLDALQDIKTTEVPETSTREKVRKPTRYTGNMHANRAVSNFPLLEDIISPHPSDTDMLDLDGIHEAESMEVPETSARGKVRKQRRNAGNIERQISCLVSAIDSFVGSSTKPREEDENEPFLKMISKKLNDLPPNIREDKKMDMLIWLHNEVSEYKDSKKDELC